MARVAITVMGFRCERCAHAGSIARAASARPCRKTAGPLLDDWASHGRGVVTEAAGTGAEVPPRRYHHRAFGKPGLPGELRLARRHLLQRVVTQISGLSVAMSRASPSRIRFPAREDPHMRLRPIVCPIL